MKSQGGRTAGFSSISAGINPRRQARQPDLLGQCIQLEYIFLRFTPACLLKITIFTL